MKLKCLFCATALLMLMALSASGEFYQYTDENGVVRFTDDPSLIPDDQREKVQTFESVKSEYNPEEGLPEAASAPSENTEAGEVKTEASELDVLNADLLREFNALQAEKEALGDPPSQTAKTSERADYNEKVKELNQKIEAYQKRKSEFDEKVKAFNSRIMNK